MIIYQKNKDPVAERLLELRKMMNEAERYAGSHPLPPRTKMVSGEGSYLGKCPLPGCDGMTSYKPVILPSGRRTLLEVCNTCHRGKEISFLDYCGIKKSGMN